MVMSVAIPSAMKSRRKRLYSVIAAGGHAVPATRRRRRLPRQHPEARRGGVGVPGAEQVKLITLTGYSAEASTSEVDLD